MPWNYLTTLDWNVLDNRNLSIFFLIDCNIVLLNTSKIECKLKIKDRMGKYASHSALDTPKNSDMKINTSQKPNFRNRSSLLLLFFIYLFFLLWKPRYLKHDPWIFSFCDLLSQTVKYAALSTGKHVRQFFADFKHDSFGKCNGQLLKLSAFTFHLIHYTSFSA